MKPQSILHIFLVLLVSGISTAQDNGFKKTIYTSTLESGNHTTLISAMDASEISPILDSDVTFTIFAPSDKAFNKLSGGRMNELLKPENKKELQEVLTYHMVAGNLSASKILRAMDRGKGTATFTTVQGKKIKASMDGLAIILSDEFGNKAKITTADGDQCNGIMHVIDSVFMPEPLK
ncbi:MAG: fasciclin domain-containing protein [Eudoraea sp.]|nr:fasciclin domain-containing protein [Eudoraea sp.]